MTATTRASAHPYRYLSMLVEAEYDDGQRGQGLFKISGKSARKLFRKRSSADSAKCVPDIGINTRYGRKKQPKSETSQSHQVASFRCKLFGITSVVSFY